MSSKLTEVSNNKAFKGWQKVFSHESSELKCKMNFGVYLPQQAETTKLPVIYFLSGLTCSEGNFIQKSGIQKYASDYNVIIVNPDTSPRGEDIPDDSDYDFGVGASFYVDAIQEPWNKNFKMYTYITKELRGLINREFPVLTSQQSIMGHSMGGHGAIMIALKNPGMFKSVSAFAPICNPIECPWGKKAFGGYLGTDKDSMNLWKGYDSTCLAKKYNGPSLDILIDQGKKDSFIEQLMPDKLVAASKSSSSSSSSSKSSSKSTSKGLTVTLRNHDGYDHSYFFISTFIKDHVKHHIKYIKNKK